MRHFARHLFCVHTIGLNATGREFGHGLEQRKCSLNLEALEKRLPKKTHPGSGEMMVLLLVYREMENVRNRRCCHID